MPAKAGFFMPAHTYQIAIKEDGQWLREYVCASDRVGAVQQFLEEHPMLSIEFLYQADALEVERCD